MMSIEKSKGVTPTEELLADLCERTFLKLWSYPNPVNENQDELCDLLAVFENHVFIFFDRENHTLDNKDKDPTVNWARWKRKVIDAQIKTANGVERYIKKGRKIFLDQELKTPFPIDVENENLIYHKIIVAHGAKNACEEFSEGNIYGSLAVSYGKLSAGFQVPFFIDLDKENPVHVFDSHNLPIIFSELDTFFDLTSFLDAKVEAIKTYDSLCYCGEEDLLAHYFMNFDEEKSVHYIGTLDKKINGVYIGEGEWHSFIQGEIYKRKKQADKHSYLWDKIIQKTCEFTLEGTLLGENTPLEGRSAIHEMAKEPRFHRRMLSSHMKQAIKKFPESSEPFVRNLSFMPSFYEKKGYAFLQLKAVGYAKNETEYREKRQAMLEIACGAAKNKFPHLETIIGIGIDAPKYAERNSEDFILLDCSTWSSADKEYYEKANEDLNFFNTDNLSMQRKTSTEFPDRKNHKNRKQKKIGRNEKCLCGSGKKYKKCCINIPLK